MRNTNRLLALSLALAASLSLAACGGAAPAASSEAAPASSAPVSSEAASGTSSEPTAELLTLKVGASPAPHAEILEQVKPLLEKEGIQLEIVEFTDYVTPNMALDGGDLDANYFQHEPYLLNFNEKQGTKLVTAAYIHYEPLGLYPGKTASIDALPEGGTIAVPNDTTNEARALQLIQSLGLITLKDGVGLEATPLDIVDNPKKLKFTEIEAAQLTNTLPDVDLAVINGNYALSGGVADKALTNEVTASDATRDFAKEYANIVAVREGDDARPELQQLVKALQSEEIVKFINEKYNGTVLPVV